MNPPPALSINKDVQFLEQETTTLLVKNLPDISESDRLDFLKHFSPQEVRLGTSKSMKNSAFLDFPDRLSAANAFSKIQELGDIEGKKIRVEYALPSKEALQKKGNPKIGGNSGDNVDENKDDLGLLQSPPPPPPFPPPPTLIAEPIAPSLGINYPAPPTLYYRYPPPTVEILYNIMNAIAAVPKLYTQVLHLMNKMNLPPPFGPILPESVPTLLQQYQIENNDNSKKRKKRDELLSDDESEIDSEIEEQIETGPLKKSRTTEILPGAAPPIPVTSYINPMFIGPPVDPIIIPESTTPRAVPQLSSSPAQFSSTLKNETLNDSIPAENKLEEIEFNTNSLIQKADSSAKYITLEELNSKKMSTEELIKISAMKNYEPGQPKSTLYIKNLAPKKAKKEDLEYLFGKYYHTKSQMDIRLHSRGQAFVIFPDVEMATQALNDVHGFVLHNKPMVIQFSNKIS